MNKKTVLAVGLCVVLACVQRDLFSTAALIGLHP